MQCIRATLPAKPRLDDKIVGLDRQCIRATRTVPVLYCRVASADIHRRHKPRTYRFVKDLPWLCLHQRLRPVPWNSYGDDVVVVRPVPGSHGRPNARYRHHCTSKAPSTQEACGGLIWPVSAGGNETYIQCWYGSSAKTALACTLSRSIAEIR